MASLSARDLDRSAAPSRRGGAFGAPPAQYARGHPRRDDTIGKIGRHHRPRPDHHLAADAPPTQDLRPRSQPDVVTERDAPRGARLFEHGEAGALELVPATHEVGVGGEEPVAPDADPRPREDLGVEAHVHVIAEDDVAVLAGEDRAAADEHTVADIDPAIPGPLRVEDHEVVDGDVVAEADLPGMPQHDPLTEDDVAAGGPEQPRIEETSKQEPERTGHPRAREHDHLVEEEPAEAAAAHDEVLILPQRGAPRLPQSALDRHLPSGPDVGHAHRVPPSPLSAGGWMFSEATVAWGVSHEARGPRGGQGAPQPGPARLPPLHRRPSGARGARAHRRPRPPLR